MYDIIVIGGGPAGYLAAERAGHAGMKTLLIEKRFVGGVCLNEGCVPSKALLYSAKIADNAAHGDKYGVKVENVSIDHAAVVARKNKVVKTLVGGIRGQLKRFGVELVEAEAAIQGRVDGGFAVTAGGNTYEGKKLLICTGSVPVMPPIPGLRENYATGTVLTNREILDLPEVPKDLVIIGGGVIGLEMASYFNSAGSHVTVVEMLDHIAGNTDKEIGLILQKNYQKKGVTFNLGCKVVEVGADFVAYEKDGKREQLHADKVLCSIGRRAFTDNLGVEKLGVEVNRGAIKTDEHGQTNIPGVYAAGDVNGTSMLAHTAYREAEVAINHMLGKKDRMRYNAIPAVIYTNPEVACVGMTEEAAKAAGIEYEVANVSMRYSGRYVAENEGGDGITKVLVDKKYRNILGVHMIGNYSSEIIYGAVMMMEAELCVEDIKEIVFPHPTVCEILREAMFEL